MNFNCWFALINMKNKHLRNVLLNLSCCAIMIITYIRTDGRQLIPFSDKLEPYFGLIMLACPLVLIFNYIRSTKILIAKKEYIRLALSSVSTLILLLFFICSLYRYYR